MLALLKELTELNGVSGYEDMVREFIQNKISPYCEVITDSMGNLIAHKQGKSYKKVMICAHMDEVGFIISKITDDGYLQFETIGGIDPNLLISKKILINGIQGVISRCAVHLTTKDEREKDIKIKDLYIDIGAKDRENAEKFVQIGDLASFDSDFIEFGDGIVKGKALDDRAGCAILIELLKHDWDFDFYAIFSVQEEVGLRGARTAANRIKPHIALVLEATICNDLTGVPEHEQVTKMGNGAAISVLDGASLANPQLVKDLVNTAETNNIKYQYKASTRGGNDAGAIHISSGGIKTASISVPCRYIHSPICTMSMDDFYAVYNLVYHYLLTQNKER